MQQIIYEFVYDLSLSASNPEKSQEFLYYCKILSQDKNFMAAVEDIYKNRHKCFEKGYQMLNNKIYELYKFWFSCLVLKPFATWLGFLMYWSHSLYINPEISERTSTPDLYKQQIRSLPNFAKKYPSSRITFCRALGLRSRSLSFKLPLFRSSKSIFCVFFSANVACNRNI